MMNNEGGSLPGVRLGSSATREPAALARVRHLFGSLSTFATFGAGIGGRVVTATVQFAAIRILTEWLGIAHYAAFAIIIGLTGWLALIDLGFGNALQNHISSCRVSGRPERDAISAVLWLLSRVVVGLLLLVVPLSTWVGPMLLRSFSAIERFDASCAMIAFSVIGVVTGVGSIVQKILFAEHRGYLAHSLNMLAALLSLAGLAILSRYNLNHRLVWATAVFSLPAALVPLAFFAPRLFGENRIQAIRHHELQRTLWRQARLFFLNSVLAALVLNVDYVILSQTVSAPTVAAYAILARVYSLAFFAYNSMLQAYWPMSAEAVQRGDYAPVGGIIARVVAFGLITVLTASALLWWMLPTVVHLLAPGGGLPVPATLIPFFAGYWVLRVWCDSWGTMILSAGRPWFLCKLAAVQAILNIALGYTGASLLGVAGYLLGSAASFLLTGVWLAPWYFRKLSKASQTGS